MNDGFQRAQGVERQAWHALEPFLKERSDGRFVLCNKGPMARHLQQVTGDAIFNADDRMWSVEIKAEKKHTGNLFLETWSNRNLEDRNSHASRGMNPGWMCKIRADLLWYYFLDVDKLYIFDFFKLKRWAYGCGDKKPRLFDFPEKRQEAYDQLNDTLGRVVPIDTLSEEIGFRLVRPRQIPLFHEAA